MMQNQLLLGSIEESIITDMIHLGISTSLECGRNVIVDQTNCKLKYLQGFIFRHEDNPRVDIKLKILSPKLDTLLSRNIERSKITGLNPIPEASIVQMNNNLTKMLVSPEFINLTKRYECERLV